MCIIIVKEKGKKLQYPELNSALNNASIHNCHGSGIAIKKEGSNNIILSKGYVYKETLLEKIEEFDVQDNDELMVHLRFATSGETDIANCHPFVISKDINEIIVDEAIVTDKPVVSHNGTFYMYNYTHSKYSDTIEYIRKFLSQDNIVESLNKINNINSYELNKFMNGNRLCIMYPDKDKDMSCYGNWNKRKSGTLKYSNYYHIQPYEGYKLLKENRA